MLGAMLGEAWHAMGANRMRSFLTMLGMMIGVGAVVIMMAIGQGAQYAVMQSINAMGSNLFIVLSGAPTSSGARAGSGSAVSLTMQDAQLIEELEGVIGAAPVRMSSAQMIYGPNNWNTSVIGTSPSYLNVRAWNLASGYSFSESDMRSATRVALIGQTVAENLFDDVDPTGKTLRINQSPFTVLGVLERKGQSMDGRDQDDTVIVPLTTAQRKLFGGQFSDSVRMIMVQASSPQTMNMVENGINSLLRQRHKIREGEPSDFMVRNLTAAAESEAETTRTMSLLLGAIASISLLVGGIGIMNIMLVSVTERTREIGVRKALGATKANILLQFLIEAVVLCLLGGLVGVIIGAGGAIALSKFGSFTTQVSTDSIILAFVFSAVVGVVFGVWPARRAATLDPITALRYE